VAVTTTAHIARPRQWSTVVAWALWALAMLGLATIVVFDQLLRRAGRPELTALPAVAPGELATLVAVTVGALVATRRPHHPVGWLLLVFGLVGFLSDAAFEYAHYALRAERQPPVAARYVLVAARAGFLAVPCCMSLVLLLTPTGSLPSPRWRWLAIVSVTTAAVAALAVTLGPGPLDVWLPSVASPIAVDALAGPLQLIATVAGLVLSLTALVAAASLVVRFRRARGLERQQLRWLTFPAALAPLAALSAALGGAAATPNSAVAAHRGGWIWAISLELALVHLTIGAAVVRYRLYDLDRIISRTLAYGLLTVLLGGGYALLVLGLGHLLGQDHSNLIVAGATLAVAAVFQPARRRIQQLVDRHFNRRRYDAAQTIAGFSARLRQHVDLDSLTTELLAVVEATMQPTQAWLWLKVQPPSGTAGASMAGHPSGNECQ
jgi:hypothetical protein